MNQAKCIGMDVHQATISVAVMDSTGKLILESILETLFQSESNTFHGAFHSASIMLSRVEGAKSTGVQTNLYLTAREDEERLAQVIRDKPGQTQADVVAASGIPKGRARSALQQGEGRLWRSDRGAHNAVRFFPMDVREIVEIEV
jgi:hypothetical protein